MSNIPRFSQKERVYKVNSRDSGFKLSMRPEKKNTVRMQSIVEKFTKPGSLVMNASAGTSCVAEACMLLPKKITFIGCEVDSHGLTEAMLALVMLYAR